MFSVEGKPGVQMWLFAGLLKIRNQKKLIPANLKALG